MKPLIGLVGRRKRGEQITDVPPELAALELDVYFADYARGVLAAGGLAMHVPIDADPADVIERCDGLLLSGGADIDPARYGRASETDLYPPERERDVLEFGLMDAALERGTPTLGICRGIQITNVHGGGTLLQHVPEHSRIDLGPAGVSHDVAFTPGSTLAGVYGERRSVNSLHHQTIDDVAPGYRVAARAGDGTVEGLEHPDLPIVAVQWHPEMMTGGTGDPIFGWLVDAAVRSRA